MADRTHRSRSVRARRQSDGAQSGITFLDVAGVDEPRQELQEVVEFL
jgi:ATP-dependent Zn protease